MDINNLINDEKTIVKISYYQKNREKCIARDREYEVQCECSSIVTAKQMSVHKRSKKHILIMELIAMKAKLTTPLEKVVTK